MELTAGMCGTSERDLLRMVTTKLVMRLVGQVSQLQAFQQYSMYKRGVAVGEGTTQLKARRRHKRVGERGSFVGKDLGRREFYHNVVVGR